MQCALYDAGRCRSCQWITQSVNEQLSAKTADLHRLLVGLPVEQWCAPIGGPEQHFRNKAKMVVSGSVEKPLFGMLHRDGTPVDLCGCPLYPASFAPVFSALKPFIARAGLTPYNVARKRGELKYLLLTESQFDGGMMLRFVLRSETKLTQLRAALPWLRAQLPQLRVITANIQPVHMAIMEGETEIYLTDQQALDSTQFATAQGETPDLVLVNPPRRGIGKPLCDYLAQMAPRFIIYSSCNAQTMAQDIRHLPNYRIQRVQLFDMFPHTAHYEVLALLRRL
ncbi:hypothetical protein KO888_001725 [Salmonella enterica]|nr:hypothetical protein [Salmonella enterica]